MYAIRSYYVIGVAPLGAFVGGWVSERIGPPHTLVIGSYNFV